MNKIIYLFISIKIEWIALLFIVKMKMSKINNK